LKIPIPYQAFFNFIKKTEDTLDYFLGKSTITLATELNKYL